MSLFSKLFACLLFPFILLSGCGNNDAPKDIAEQFWSFAQEKELDQAKYYVSWETASYLKYIADDKFKIAHVDLGKVTEKTERVEIDTIIVLARKQGDNIRIPTKTVLIKTEDVWRIQLQETLTGIIKQTVNEAAGQFNQMLSDGLNELDKALSESVDSVSHSLEQGAKELSNTLDALKKDLDTSRK
jgi:hypothetical protein